MKTVARAGRHRRVRSRIIGSRERPRLVVFRGSRTLSAQLVDDRNGQVLLTISSRGANLPAAQRLGAEVAKQAKAKKINQAVFDRAGYRYHGIVQAVAEAAREGIRL